MRGKIEGSTCPSEDGFDICDRSIIKIPLMGRFLKLRDHSDKSPALLNTFIHSSDNTSQEKLVQGGSGGIEPFLM